jgi:small-conductance mechanosensitive channel
VRISAMRDLPLQAFGKSSAEISELISGLVRAPIDESFEEFAEQAGVARLESLDKMAKAETIQRGIEIESESRRQEEARQQAERADEAMRQAAEREALAAERAALAATQAAANAEIKAAQDRLNAEQAAFVKEKADRLAADIARVAQIAKDEAQRIADEATSAAPAVVETRAAALAIVSMIDPTDSEIIEAVAAEFCMTPLEAIDRLARIDFLRALLAAEAA